MQERHAHVKSSSALVHVNNVIYEKFLFVTHDTIMLKRTRLHPDLHPHSTTRQNHTFDRL
ncbi:hypothetical protein ACHAXS_011536 [Conticribra weissflogii]